MHIPLLQDGRSSALTAPNGPAQSEVLTAALKDACLEGLSALAMHGTATPLGDPIGGRWTDASLGWAAVAVGYAILCGRGAPGSATPFLDDRNLLENHSTGSKASNKKVAV
eukprot:scaffold187182_cov18-Tisochrysis_lutea.AAC.2